RSGCLYCDLVKTKPRPSTITSATIALHSQSRLVPSMVSPSVWIRLRMLAPTCPFPDTTHELGHKKEHEKCPSHCDRPGQVKQNGRSRKFGPFRSASRWPNAS